MSIVSFIRMCEDSANSAYLHRRYRSTRCTAEDAVANSEDQRDRVDDVGKVDGRRVDDVDDVTDGRVDNVDDVAGRVVDDADDVTGRRFRASELDGIGNSDAVGSLRE